MLTNGGPGGIYGEMRVAGYEWCPRAVIAWTGSLRDEGPSEERKGGGRRVIGLRFERRRGVLSQKRARRRGSGIRA